LVLILDTNSSAGGALVLLLCTLIGSRIPFVNLADPGPYALTVSIIVAMSLVASAVPAWRAARLDPMTSL
jgi:ABC-type antimicrobial peptide transport system permease subunit